MSMKRTVVPLVAIAMALATTAPAAHAFAGRDGKIVYSWFSRAESDLEPHLTTLDESAIRTISPLGGTPKTLRGCTQATGQPDVGDCSIGYGAPAVSPNGRRIAFDAGASLALMRIDGSGFRLLPAHSADDGEPAFSPTGGQLAFSAGSIPSAHPLTRGVWIGDLAGAHARQLTARGTSPAWSSHNWIAFLRADGVYRVRPDGHGLRRLVVRRYCRDVAWSPHGTKLAFTCRDRLLVSNGDGSHMHRVAGVGAEAVAWSPSGKRFAVSPFDGGVVTMRIDGAGSREIVPGGYSVTASFGAGGVDWQPLR